MQELIDMLKEFDKIFEPTRHMRDAGSKEILFSQLTSPASVLYLRIMETFNDCLILADGGWNRTYWKELKAMAAQQNYDLTVYHGGEDNDSAGIATPNALFWIDCVY